MENAAERARNVRRMIWIAVILIAGLLIVAAAVVTLVALAMVRMMDKTDAHVCGLAAVRESRVAAQLVGAPIEQRGFTGGSSSSENGELSESVRFTVGGPQGTAYVVSQGRRSPLESHLEVRIGRNGRGVTIYSGPFDCAELHRTSR